VSWHAVGRHGRAHLSPVQRAAILSAQRPTEIDLDALRSQESEGLLGSLVAQRARLQQQCDLALELGDVRAAVAAEGAITKNLGVTGKLLGTLVQRHEVTHSSVLLTPDYLRLRQALVLALRPYPDAARAVGAALHTLESDAAKDITPPAAGRAPVVIEHDPLLGQRGSADAAPAAAGRRPRMVAAAPRTVADVPPPPPAASVAVPPPPAAPAASPLPLPPPPC
jgi:hypothetical protein